MVSPSSLLERIASIREGSSRGVNLLLIRRLQTGVSKPSDKNHRVFGIPYKIGMGRAEDIPLSNKGVAALETRSPTLRFSSGDDFGALRVLSIRRISTMWPSTSPLLCLVCDVLAPLLSVRPISRIILERSFSMVSGQGQGNYQHTSSNPPLLSWWVHRDRLHLFLRSRYPAPRTHQNYIQPVVLILCCQSSCPCWIIRSQRSEVHR